MNTALYIAKRYIFSKSSNNAINIISIIASVGVIIASAALLVVLSGFAGLKVFSLGFSNVTDPDLKLLPVEGKSILFSQEDSIKFSQIKSISTHSKLIEEHIAIRTENKNIICTLRGVDANYLNVVPIESIVTNGNWLSPNSNEVVSGWGISNTLSFGVFDFLKRLTLYVPKAGKGQPSSINGYFNSEPVVNVGIFRINEKTDNQFVFSDIGLAQSLLDYTPNQISALDIKLQPNTDENLVRKEIEAMFPNRFSIKNRAQLNDVLFKMLNTENLAVYLIFTLVIIIAMFNVIGTIIMMILDKKASITTLFNLGATPKMIKSIFFLQGSLVTTLSGFVGVIIGITLIYLQKTFKLVPLTPDLPYPVELEFKNIILVLLTIIVLGLLASKIASQRITKNLVEKG